MQTTFCVNIGQIQDITLFGLLFGCLSINVPRIEQKLSYNSDLCTTCGLTNWLSFVVVINFKSQQMIQGPRLGLTCREPCQASEYFIQSLYHIPIGLQSYVEVACVLVQRIQRATCCLCFCSYSLLSLFSTCNWVFSLSQFFSILLQFIILD